MKNSLNLEIRYHPLLKEDLLWPADDIHCWEHLNIDRFFHEPEEISNHSNRKGLILQAGGNCGLYPKIYSRFFDKVITFEPDLRNFYCLTYNVPESNVYKFQACLGNDNKFLDLKMNDNNPDNVGSLQVIGEGNIPQLTIDSLNLSPDVIHLDIEGYEGPALEGAMETIKRSKPLIVIENKGFGNSFGWSIERSTEYLSNLGYTKYKKFCMDLGFIHKDYI